MIDTLPKGTTIGTMQASLSWIFSHTSRFVGVVRIRIQDGKGVILIDKGKAKVYYFEHGSRVLRGHAAQEYFSAQQVIDFSLDKLTPEEFAKALAVMGSDLPPGPADEVNAEPARVPDIKVPETKPSPFPVPPVTAKPAEPPPMAPAVPAEPVTVTPASQKQPEPPVVVVHGRKGVPAPVAPPEEPSPADEPPEPLGRPPSWIMKKIVTMPGKAGEYEKVTTLPVSATPLPPDLSGERPAESPVEKKEPVPALTMPPAAKKEPATPAPKPWKPEDLLEPSQEEEVMSADFRMIAEVLLGRIKAIPGVIAVMVFNKDMHLLSIGDVNLDKLVSSAEDMLMTVNQLDSVMQWGSFVQMTIQIPTGNVIIAPFFDEYLCIMTSPQINIGRIRRFLREIRGRQNR